MRVLRAVATLLLVFSFTPALDAHAGHVHKTMGTVVSVAEAPDRITVKAADGKVVTVGVDEKTKFLKGTAAATLHDVKEGSRVVVSTVEREGRQTATEVRLPSGGGREGDARKTP